MTAVEHAAQQLDALKFPTFASSLRRGDNLVVVLMDFENPPHRSMTKLRPTYGKALSVLRGLFHQTHGHR